MVRLSVIMPVYNSAEYLEDALNSVLGQSCSDFELIAVDDGSTDGSRCILERRFKHNAFARVINTPHLGPFGARRAGATVAGGDYLVFIDSDDVLVDGALAVISGLCESYGGPDIIDYQFADFESPIARRDVATRLLSSPDVAIYRANLLEGVSNSLCTRAVKKSAFELPAGAMPDDRLRYAEDLYQMLGCVDNATTIVTTERVLYRYRPSAGSTMHSFDIQYVSEMERIGSAMLEYGASWGEGCAESAERGVARQYLTLLRLAVLFGHPSDIDAVSSSLSRVARWNPVAYSGLRLDEIVLLRALFSHRRWIASSVVEAKEALKRIRRSLYCHER